MFCCSQYSKPRVLITGVGSQYGGTEIVVSRFVGELSPRFSFDTISGTPKKQSEYTSGSNREFLIPAKSANPLAHVLGIRRHFRDFASQYCAIWHNANSFANIDVLRLAEKSGIQIRVCHFHNTRFLGNSINKAVSSFNQSAAASIATTRLACSEEAGRFAYGGQSYEVLSNAFNLNNFTFSDANRESLRNELGLGDRFVIGCVGRLAEQKNQIVLIRALPEILKYRSDAVLVLVGNGPLREDLLSEARKLGVAKHLMLTGPREDVEKLLSAFDVFAFPSVFEGLGVAVVEAQANSLPCVVSTNVPSQAIVSRSAIVIPPDDSNLWAHSICSMCRADFMPDLELMGQFDIGLEADRLAAIFSGRQS